MSELNKYYGKFRGIVLQNIDPLQIGRIQVMVPDVSALIPTSWAMPCTPIAGIQMGLYAVPAIGTSVWVEFEQGDPDYPIWVGCFWGSAAEVPLAVKAVAPVTPPIVIGNLTQSNIVISDVPVPPPYLLPAGGIVLQSGASTISVGPDGVTITAPKVEINGVTILMNKGALMIT
jgi:hypothetical protein